MVTKGQLHIPHYQNLPRQMALPLDAVSHYTQEPSIAVRIYTVLIEGMNDSRLESVGFTSQILYTSQ